MRCANAQRTEYSDLTDGYVFHTVMSRRHNRPLGQSPSCVERVTLMFSDSQTGTRATADRRKWQLDNC